MLAFPAAPSQSNVRERERKRERERAREENNGMCVQSRATVHWPDRMDKFWHSLVLRIVHWRLHGTVDMFCTGKCEKHKMFEGHVPFNFPGFCSFVIFPFMFKAHQKIE